MTILEPAEAVVVGVKMARGAAADDEEEEEGEEGAEGEGGAKLHLKSKLKFSLIILNPVQTMSERDFLYLQYHVEASNDYSFDIVFSFGQEREIMYRISNEETDECGYVNVRW